MVVLLRPKQSCFPSFVILQASVFRICVWVIFEWDRQWTWSVTQWALSSLVASAFQDELLNEGGGGVSWDVHSVLVSLASSSFCKLKT